MTTTSAFTTALVTGATSGIGAATAIRLAREGLRVGVAGRDRQRGEAVVERIRSAGGGAEFLRLDLTAGSAVLLQLVDEAEDRIGPVDVLVNNAAAYPVPATDRLTDQQAATILATNVLGPHHLVAALAPRMGGRGAGAIVNVTSWMGRIGTPSGALYSASKAALEQLTRSWTAEYGPRGVRVNAVAPGVTLTDGNRRHLEVLQGIADGTPARALVRPDDIAAAIAYLASDDAARVHGTTITVDAGSPRAEADLRGGPARDRHPRAPADAVHDHLRRRREGPARAAPTDPVPRRGRTGRDGVGSPHLVQLARLRLEVAARARPREHAPRCRRPRPGGRRRGPGARHARREADRVALERSDPLSRLRARDDRAHRSRPRGALQLADRGGRTAAGDPRASAGVPAAHLRRRRVGAGRPRRPTAGHARRHRRGARGRPARARPGRTRGQDDLYAETAAAFLAVHLLTRHTEAGPPARIDRSRRAMRDVEDFMRTHLAEPITLADLAEVAHLSPYHFARTFRDTIGTPPRRRLTELRVRRATRLLRRTDLPLGEIARSCGFTSTARLTAAVRRVHGITPTAFREQDR